MHTSARDTYFETQVATATPQRLRLMLIEGALRQAKTAQAAWAAERVSEGQEAAMRCREIVGELIAGIHPDQTPVAKQVLGIYLFLFSALTEAQLSRDAHQLAGIIRVLEEEQQTWTELCQQLPERPVAAEATQQAEELAPKVVSGNWRGSYSPTNAPPRPAASAFSIDA